MNVSITLGWAVLPAIVTGASFLWAIVASAGDRPHGDYDIAGPFIALARFAAALILSLTAWLFWSLLA